MFLGVDLWSLLKWSTVVTTGFIALMLIDRIGGDSDDEDLVADPARYSLAVAPYMAALGAVLMVVAGIGLLWQRMV